MYSLIRAELNTFTPDLEVSTKDTGITNTTDAVIENVANTTAEGTAKNGAYKQVPARTNKLCHLIKSPSNL